MEGKVATAVQERGRHADQSCSVAVIIPTKNRDVDLAKTVRCLLEQTVLAKELIVVDQSGGCESRSAVETVFSAFSSDGSDGVELYYILDPDVSGLAVARNRGLDIATSEIVLFLDDDVLLEPDFIEQLVAVYGRYPAVAGVSGIITNYRRPPAFSRLWSVLFMRGPFHDTRQSIYWNADRLRNSEPIRVDRFGGGLMSFRTASLGGCRFDENLRGVSDGEDVDFCMRLAPGTVLVIAPRARLVHNQSPAGRLQDHFLRRKVRAEYFLYWKNWNFGIKNHLCFLWLNVGYALMAVLGIVRRISLDPWRGLKAGVQDARHTFREGSAQHRGQ